MKDEEVGEILITGESVADGYLEGVKNNSFIKYNGTKAYLLKMVFYIIKKEKINK